MKIKSLCVKSAFVCGLASAVTALAASAASVVEVPVGATTEEIMAAVVSAEEGGTIRFGAGIWTVTNTVVLAKGVTVEGAGPAATVLDFGGRCRGFELSHASARVANLKIFRASAYGEKVSCCGGGVMMTDGTVTNCLIESCVVGGTIGKGHVGGGVFVSGGLVTGCEIRGCTIENLYGFGNAVYMKGGRVDGCDVHSNNGGFSHPTPAYGGGVVCVERGVFENSKVHHNLKNTNPGVQVFASGTVRNCLVYGNRGKYGAGGVYMDGGTVDFCTVSDNEVSDRPGRSGLRCLGGTVKNSVFWANGAAGGCEVKSGSAARVVHNVFDRTLGDHPENRVSDPLFADAANGDFAIASRFSPAYGYALSDPSVKADFAGAARNPDAPSCGALEFDPSDETFGADILFEREVYAAGADVTVEAALTGADLSDVTIAWTLDGEPRAETDRVLTIRGLALGSHSLRLEVVRKSSGEKVVRDYPGRILVRPTVGYVNMSGSATAPYDTFEKGSPSLGDVLAALGVAPGVTSVVHVAGGSYTLPAGVILREKVRILGEGRDVVTFYCPEERAFVVDNVAAEVSGVTVNGGVGAFEVSAGRVVSCRAQNVQTSLTYAQGAGFKVSGGEVLDCEAIDCSAHGITGGGGGLSISDGLVSNLLVRNCRGYDARSGTGAVAASGGTLKRVVVTGTTMDNIEGCAIWASPRDGRRVLLDSCVFTCCTSANARVVSLVNVDVRNCRFAGNVGMNGLKSTVELTGGTYENCTFAGNDNPKTCVKTVDVTARNTVFAESGGGVNVLSGRFVNCRAPSLPGNEDGSASVGCDETVR